MATHKTISEKKKIVKEYLSLKAKYTNMTYEHASSLIGLPAASLHDIMRLHKTGKLKRKKVVQVPIEEVEDNDLIEQISDLSERVNTLECITDWLKYHIAHSITLGD